MRRMITICTIAIATTSLSLVPGCAPITIPVPVSLTNAGVGSFDVTAGTPLSAKANFTFALDQRGGSGRLSIDPADISVNPANTGGAKVLPLNLQEQNACADACATAGVDATICNQVCVEGDLRVTINLGTQAAIGEDCTAGDEYVFDVTLDENGNATSVAVSPASMTQQTIDLLNTGMFGACVEVISPIDGTVIVDTLTFNVGL